MMEQQTKNKGNVIIDPTMTFTDSDLLFFLTGMSMQQFVEDVVHDTTGKYDALYEDAS